MQTDEGLAHALKAGTLGLIYLAALNGISAAAAILSAVSIEPSPGEANSFPISSMLIMMAILILATVAASILVVLFWKRHSVVAAMVGLIWILGDVIGHQGISLALPAVPLGISGVRGALAAKRRQDGRADSLDE